jgi:hypothetical protein
MFKFKPITLIISASVLLLTGCSTAQLSNVQQNRGNYNVALNKSDNEQFLLNIVRMRFDKSPFFIGVDSITTQTTLSYSTGGKDTTVGNAAGQNGAFWNFQPNIEFKHTPTVTYSPLQGTSYISGLLAPITVVQFNYLVQTNLNLASTFKLTVDNIGTLSNLADTWVRDGSDGSSTGVSFNHLVDFIDQSRVNGKLGLFATNYQNNPALVLVMKDDATAAQVSKELQLDKTYRKIILSPMLSTLKSGNVVQFRTRSFFAVLNFISYGVDISANDEKKFGVSSNELKVQDQMTDNLFRLRSSETSPVNAYTKVSYEGRWYYLTNDDITSKTTLMFLKLIYSLEAGEVSTNPWGTLDIPVAKD